MTVVDLFAGPGGWSVAARDLGIHEVGVEHDASACATRAAAGHLTIRQDVTTLDTARFRPLDGLIASPPCPTFSAAGGRAGIAELRYLIEHVHACVTEWKPYVPPANLGYDDESGKAILPDPRSALVLEPLRFALECVPTWIALEQVPDVMPVWEAMAYVLRAHGWSVWCGVLNAADFGVPQTRRRAILIAHRRKDVTPPEPTHCEGGASTLLGELAPWVSMAEALGWGCAPVVNTRGDRGDDPAGGNEFSADRPSWCLTEKARSWTVTGNNTIAGGPLAEREITEPAMTVGSRADLWTLHTNRGQDDNGDRQTRDTSAPAPAPALSAKAGGQWVFERPATTVQGDPRLGSPGHRDREGGEPQFGVDALRLTVEDALRLQSFDASYPVQGTKTKRFEQIGNAIPVLLARHILSEVL